MRVYGACSELLARSVAEWNIVAGVDPDIQTMVAQIMTWNDAYTDPFEDPVHSFSYYHEWGHFVAWQAGSSTASHIEWAGGKTYQSLSRLAHTSLLTGAALGKEWDRFFYENSELCRLTERCEELEEIFANYIAWSYFLFGDSIERARDEFEWLKGAVRSALQERGFLSSFSAFLKACGGEWQKFADAKRLLNCASLCLLLDKRFDTTQAIERSRISIERFGDDTYRVVCDAIEFDDVDRRLEMTADYVIRDMVAKSKFYVGYAAKQRQAPAMIFPSNDDPHYIALDEFKDHGIKLNVFWESLRQQISQVRGIVCPFMQEGMNCCGRADLAANIWRRLPQEYRSAMQEPTCRPESAGRLVVITR